MIEKELNQIKDKNIRSRVKLSLTKVGCKSFDDLITKRDEFDIDKIRGFGKKSLEAVCAVLREKYSVDTHSDNYYI